MDSNFDSINNSDSSINSSEDIDFKRIFNFLVRNKKFISSISIVFMFLGFLLSFFPKKTWEGQFQVVLSEDKKSSAVSMLSPVAEALGKEGPKNNLKTEVGILQSPSVLMPAFKLALGNNNEFSSDTYEFLDWKKKKLSIVLEKKTSILNIKYKDQNQSIILPVLNKISSTYQEYADQRKKRIDENTEDYLKKQIEFYREKSAKSLKKAQEFAIDQDLYYFNITQAGNSRGELSVTPGNSFEVTTESFLPQNINIENIRVSAANELRSITLQLKKIEELNDIEELRYVGSSIRILQDASASLNLIESQLVDLRSKYTEEDNSIKRLLEKRNLAILTLKERTINYLKSRKLEAEARMEASLRPKGVLTKYKELVRVASRDENTLMELENELRTNEIDKSRRLYPYELITKPSLLKKPVGTLKRDLTLIGLLLGAFLSSFYKYFKEKKSTNIFEFKDFKDLIGLEFGKIIKFKYNQLNDENNTFLNEYINIKFKDGINLIKLGDLEEYKSQIIKEYLIRNKIKIDLFNSILDLKNKDNSSINFIILELGFLKFSQVKNLKKYLELFGINIEATIILEK